MTSPIHRLWWNIDRKLEKRRDAAESRRWLDQASMLKLHASNRQTLASVPNWIDETVWKESIFQYGLPPNVRHLIDCDIGEGLSYTDAMLGLANQLKQPVAYLEIGVSVGKNFLQVARHLTDASLTGFDIEEINPTLAAFFERESRVEFQTAEGSMKKAPSSLTTFGMPKQRNRVDYLSGDIFDPGAWSKLAGRQFNLVFSDAFHSADALRTEADAILSHGLLHPDEVVVVWDDLNGEMADAFRAICGRFAAARHGCRSTSFVVPLKGWLGNNWDDHPVGFFVSLRR